MAYAQTGLSLFISKSESRNDRAIWLYESDDIHTDVDGTGYFDNGANAGMRVGDIVMAARTITTPGVTMHRVSAVTPGGAATVTPAIVVV